MFLFAVKFEIPETQFNMCSIQYQQKKIKQHREMGNNLKKGDKIITTGGLIGNIIKVNENKEIILEIADNVEVKLAAGMVSELINKIEKK